MSAEYELTVKQNNVIKQMVRKGVGLFYDSLYGIEHEIVQYCNAWDMDSFDVITCINHIARLHELKEIGYGYTDSIRCFLNPYGQTCYEVI
jgi:hypothetical protein